MAHFAQIGMDNIVLRVDVVRDEDILDGNGNESEEIGIKHQKSVYGQQTNWLQTSYNNNFRCRYAGVGMIYNNQYDVFLNPRPYPSWILNTETYEWDPPVPEPELSAEDTELGNHYEWDENTQKWVIVEPLQQDLWYNQPV